MTPGLSFSVCDRPFHLIVSLLVPGAKGYRYLIMEKSIRTAPLRYEFHVRAIRWLSLQNMHVTTDLRSLRLFKTPYYG